MPAKNWLLNGILHEQPVRDAGGDEPSCDRYQVDLNFKFYARRHLTVWTGPKLTIQGKKPQNPFHQCRDDRVAGLWSPSRRQVIVDGSNGILITEAVAEEFQIMKRAR
jgi:hypothetical protein